MAFLKLKEHREESRAQRKSLQFDARGIVTACFTALRHNPAFALLFADILQMESSAIMI